MNFVQKKQNHAVSVMSRFSESLSLLHTFTPRGIARVHAAASASTHCRMKAHYCRQSNLKMCLHQEFSNLVFLGVTS